MEDGFGVWIIDAPEEAGCRAEVLIGIVDPVGIKLDLVVIEVEVRTVRPVTIGVPVLSHHYLYHRNVVLLAHYHN